MARKTLAVCGITLSLLYGSVTGTAQAALPVFEQPVWSALGDEQRAILAPLQEDWATMDAFRRKKWLGIAQRYPDMTPEEQAGIQRNMREWALLSSEERRIAREQYKKLKKVEPEKRQAVKQKWKEYNALPVETRDKLRSEAAKRPAVKTPTKPPAPQTRTTVKPATPTALTTARSPLSPLKPPQSPLLPPEGKPVPPTLPQQP